MGLKSFFLMYQLIGRKHFWALLFICISSGLAAQKKIIVDQQGGGDFVTIQEAINSLPDSSAVPRIIFIKKGIYKEKIYIKKTNIVLEGEDPRNTIITAAIARDEWRCAHPDDWGVAVLNIGANDITLRKLTITNSFGFDFTPQTMLCAADSNKSKVLAKNGHQMALRTMNATRLRAFNCIFRSFGGDTVSPWEVNNGLWYFKNCIMEGGVDFYCPRGWAWAEDCQFISHSGTAAIWHDGSGNPDATSVLVRCTFKGFDQFLLGRYHREAQFFLINCTFGHNMRDSSIYLVPTANPIQWGERIYFYGCHREKGKDFDWFANHLPIGIESKDITVQWVFGKRWNPAIN